MTVFLFFVNSPAFACSSTMDEIFKDWDTNGDGVITIDEFDTTDLYAGYYKPDVIEKKHKELKDYFDNKIDENKDGKIEWEERKYLPSKYRCGGK